MEYDFENDCYCELKAMPAAVKGCCASIGGNDYIFINEVLSMSARREAYRHEVRHLKRCDLTSEKSVKELER